MAGLSFLDFARRLLARLLVGLVVALAGTVVVVQLGGDGERAETASGPRIGDHWHAAYAVFICDERQPHFPLWEGGVHTHTDGIIHIHPLQPFEEGEGASLSRWFEYGGGLLTLTEMRMPGNSTVVENGDVCLDGRRGELRVVVNGVRLGDWTRYVPRHGDEVLIVFGPP